MNSLLHIKSKLKHACMATALTSTLLMACGAKDYVTEVENSPVKNINKDMIESEYMKHWTGKPSIIKINDELVVSVPQQYHRFWIEKSRWWEFDIFKSDKVNISKIPTSESFGFDMFLPELGGYTNDNFQNQFDENKINVIYVRQDKTTTTKPEAPGYYPPNMFQRRLKYDFRQNLQKFERFGLNCYESMTGNGNYFCYGDRDSNGEKILLEIMHPPYDEYITFPMMSAKYYTKAYGGLEIAWRSHMKNFHKWKEIDGKIWSNINNWNIIK